MIDNQIASKALVIGGSGLVGRKLVSYLVNDSSFKEIVIFSRRPLNIIHKKIRVIEVNFNNLGQFKDEIKGDVVFSCMGTTRKSAGSKEAQTKVDHDYQVDFANFARQNGVKTFVLVSSIGANSRSMLFYPRIKGQTEEDIIILGFNKTIILRPSTLVGKRESRRPIEEFFAKITQVINLLPSLKKYSPIHASKVARTMVDSAKNSSSGVKILESDEIYKIAINSSLINR